MKRLLIMLLIACMFLCNTFTFTAVAIAEENNNISESELMPCSATSADQYSNRYFKTLADAKNAYGQDFTYHSCGSVWKNPGCYGGYWSDGGEYTYYIEYSDGSRCYLHVGVEEL